MRRLWPRKKNDTPKDTAGNEKSAGNGSSDEQPAIAPDLTDSQVEIIRAQGDTTSDDKNSANLFTPYRYASRGELLLVACSAICSIGSGLPIPLMIVVFGQLVGNVSEQSTISANSQSAASLIGGGSRNKQVLYLVYLAIAEFGLTFISTAGWQHTGRRIARKVRERYFEALLRQNVGFFDTFGTGKVTSHITSDMNQIQDGISEKVGLTLRTIATVIAAFVIGYVQYWALALILSSSLLAIMLIGGSLAAPMGAWTKKSGVSTSEASVVAEETFASVKTVLAMNMKQRILNRYRVPVQSAEGYSWRAKAMLGLLLAATMWIVNLIYGLAFWQGGRFMRSNPGAIDVGGILITLMAIMTGSMSVAAIAPNVQAFVTGASAAAAVFKVINRKSPIDVSASEGLDASSISGDIKLSNVRSSTPLVRT